MKYLTLLAILWGSLIMADSNEYETLDEAVKSAHSAINNIKDSHKYEYMSVVYLDPKTNKYKYTTPRTEQKRRQAEVKIRIPKGSARALYHNHPSSGKHDNLQDKFSQGDVDLAGRLGIPSFIGAGSKVFQWNPEEPGKMQSKGGAGSTVKEQVGEGTLFHDFEAEEAQDLRRLVQIKAQMNAEVK